MTIEEAKSTKVGQYFTLWEFLESETAEELGLIEKQLAISPEHIENIKYLCAEVLDRLRNQLGPIAINSGYRCIELNEAVNGSANSQHRMGEAADIDCVDNECAFKYIKNRLWFDQNINEFNYKWIHVSKKRTGRNRMESFKLPK